MQFNINSYEKMAQDCGETLQRFHKDKIIPALIENIMYEMHQ